MTTMLMPKLTVGLDLGDTTSHTCALDAQGQVVTTGRVRTTPAALEREFTRWSPSRVVLEVGTGVGGVEGAGAAGRAQRGKRHLTIT